MRIVPLIIFLLIEFCLPSRGEDRAEYLIQAFDYLPFDTSNIDLIHSFGERMHKFIIREDQTTFLKSRNGQDLLSRFNKLTNFLYLSRSFETLLEDQENFRMLPTRLLNVGGGVNDNQLYTSEQCVAFYKGGQSFEELIADIGQINNQMQIEGLNKQLLYRAIKQAISSYYKVVRNFKDAGFTPDEMLEDICLKIGQCDQQTVIFLRRIIDEQLDDSCVQRYSLSTTTNNLNDVVQKLNQYLREIEDKFEVEEGRVNLGLWKSDKVHFTRESELAYRSYTQEYITSLTSDIGPLMLSDPLREKLGNLRSMQGSLKKRKQFSESSSRFFYQDHLLTDELEVSTAFLSVKDEILNEISILMQLYFEGDKGLMSRIRPDISKTLVHLIKNNPGIVGVYLLEHPQYAHLISKHINTIIKDDYRLKTTKKVVGIGGTIIGGGLLLTGIGSAIGAAVVAPSATIAATTAAATLGTAATITGIGIKTLEIFFLANYARDAYNQKLQFERAFLAGGGDFQSVSDISTIYQEYHEAKVNTLATLGFVAFDILGLSLMNVGGLTLYSGSAQTTKNIYELINYNSQIIPILKNENFVYLLNDLKEIIGPNNLASFLKYLVKLSQNLQYQLLNELCKWDREKGSLLPTFLLITSSFDKLPVDDKNKVLFLEDFIRGIY